MQHITERPGAVNAGTVGILSFSSKAKVTTKHRAMAIERVVLDVLEFGKLFTDDERSRIHLIGATAAAGGLPVFADQAFLGRAYSRVLRTRGVA